MNTQINEDYVSFETAKLLKEKGFNIPCDNYYDSSGKTPNESVYGGASIETLDYNEDPFVKFGFPKFKTFSAPTLQMAMKWLRGLYWLNMYPKYNKWSNKWSIVILSLDDREIIKGNTAIQIDGFVSYEEAVNEGIKYCLTNLI